MLSQLKHLSLETEGRYASDTELQFMSDYVQSFNLRLQTYQKLQELEPTLVPQAYAKMRAIDSSFFIRGQEDLSPKWKRDTLCTLRYTAVAVLMNDPDTMRSRMLIWLETITRALGAEKNCGATYQVLQDLVKQHLTPPQASLVCPILEMTRRSLGAVS
jgi:Phycobilisome protein